MSAALIIVYVCLVAVEVAVVVVWVAGTRRHHWPVRPSTGDVVIGGATSFLDTLGIGNYAQITALFKLRGRPPDELIPGTLNVGNAVGILFSAVLFVTAIQVEPVLLMTMVICAGAGAWIGAGIVSRMRRRVIQVFMGMALLLAAGFFTMTNLGVIPPTGSAMGLAGWRFVLASAANFVLGALMCVGIGNYAPSMALLALLGMHPIAAYPIMMASDGVLIPVASLGFLRSARFDPAVAVGLTIGGIIGTVAAFPLIKTLADHLTLMRWVVTGVITYAAIAMLRSAWVSQSDLPAPAAAGPG
ncbi:MAG TPA: hypothetical protein VNY70_04570 [Steroidobacteraceae bacterium]|nr:hypothetical protein [Steroidobacteraceae bacterium]